MKDIIKRLKIAPSAAQKMILINIIFSLTMLTFSAIFFYFAEQSGAYYCAKELSFELIKALRSCSTILAVGTVIIAHLEK